MPQLTGFSPVDIRGPRALPFFGVQLNAMRLVADPIGRCMALHHEFGDVVAVADRSPGLVLAFGAERNREVGVGCEGAGAMHFLTGRRVDRGRRKSGLRRNTVRAYHIARGPGTKECGGGRWRSAAV